MRCKPYPAGCVSAVAARLILFALAATVPCAQHPAAAGVIRHDRDPQAYLDLGNSPAFASVGRFDITRSETGYAGSGTLISDRWVLTAAHLLEGTQSMRFAVGDAEYEVQGWLAHPKFKGDLRKGYDAALVRLAEPVSGVAPAKLYKGKRERGKVGTFVGFGRTGDGQSGDTGYDAVKRAGQNVIDATIGKRANTYKKLSGGSKVFVADFDAPGVPGASVTGDPDPLDLEFLISLGDSGGGVFIEDDAKGAPPGAIALAGIHSFGEIPDGRDDSDYGDVTGHVRVSPLGSWIRSTLKRDAKGQRLKKFVPAGDEVPMELSLMPGLARGLVPETSFSDEAHAPGAAAAAAVVPEPSGAWLLLSGAALLLRRGRRRPESKSSAVC